MGRRYSRDYNFFFTLKTGPNSFLKKQPMEAINTEMFSDFKYYKEKTYKQSGNKKKKKHFYKSEKSTTQHIN